MSFLIPRKLWLLRAVLALLSLWIAPRSLSCFAQDNSPNDGTAKQLLRFRRIYGPADQLKDWLRGNVKYIPMEPAEFERLIDLADADASSAPRSTGVQLVSAEYQARLVGNRLTAGNAVLRVDYSADEALLLPLEPCALAIGKTVWSEATLLQDAVLGAGPDGSLAVLVERPGVLQLSWSLEGYRDQSDILHFDIELPRCPVNGFAIDAPEGMTLTSDQGVVLEMGKTDEGMRHWRIELGGHSCVQLSAMSAAAPRQRAQLAWVKEAVAYDVSPQGLDVSAQLKFDVGSEPLSQVVVLLDPGLLLLSARCGNLAVPWTVVSSESGKETKLLLTLPEPIRDSGRALRLAAIAPLMMDCSWQLPRIRLEQVFWQEGTATLSVPSPLEVKRLAPIGGRQTGTNPLSAREGELDSFQYASPDGAVEVVLGFRDPVLQLVSGASVVFGHRETTARIAADFHSADAPQFLLEADVLPLWQIDVIESQPPGAIDNWIIDQEGSSRKLTIRLLKAVAPEEPLRIVAVARRQYVAAGQPLNFDQVSPLRFRASSQVRRLVSVRAVEPNQLRIVGMGQFRGLDFNKLDPSELELFPDAPQGLLLEDDAEAAARQIVVESRKPKLPETTSEKADAGPPAGKTSYIWHCHLESWYQADGVGRHLVSFRMQNAGDGQLNLTLPSGVSPKDVGGVWMDDVSTTWSEVEGDDANAAIIELPAANKYPTVRLLFSTPASAWGMFVSLRPPLVKTDLPVLEQHWTVWAPPGYGSLEMDRWQSLGVSPLSWRQRLFGPLGRSSGRNAFDPLHPRNWLADFKNENRQAERIASQRKVEGLLQVLGTLAAKDASLKEPAAADWASLIGSRQIESLQIRWIVDRHALGQLQLTPQSRLRNPSGDTPLDCGIDLLRQADLALLVHGNAVMLTSLSEAMLLQAWLAPLEYRGTWCVLPGPLAEQLSQAVTSNDITLPSAAIWKEQPPEPMPPWPATSLADRGPADSLGWTVCRAQISDAQPIRVFLVRGQSMRMLGSVAFLLVVALGWWTLGKRQWALLALAIATAAAALLLPAAFVPIPSGALLGSLFCLLAFWKKNKSRISVAPQLGIFVSITTAAVLLGNPSGAVAQTANPSPSTQPVYHVMIPIDAKEQPTGDMYFLPEEFYAKLHQLAAAAAKKSQGWMLGAAIYRGTLSREASTGRLGIEKLRASFDLHVLNQTARVRIDWPREGANLLPDGILLDDRVIQAEWEPDGESLVFDVPSSGKHRLELAFRPNVHAEGGLMGFDMAIPRLANSRLELLLPGNAPAIEVQTAYGSVWQEDDPRQLLADLGPTDRLVVCWPIGAKPPAAGPALDVDELLWLRIKPGQVVLDAKFKLRLLEGQVQQIQLQTDPRLRLLPLQGEDAPTAEVRSVPGQPQTIVLHWAKPVADRTILEAKFLLTETSGVGNLRPPQLEVLDARTTRRWMAVSVDPTLERTQSEMDPADAITAAEFINAWGKSDSQPSFVSRLTSTTSKWSISTSAREPQTTVEQTLALGVGEESMAILLEAQLATTAGYNFQIGLKGPPQLLIERISLLENGSECVSRWSQDKDGAITVFLGGPTAGRQTFSLRGRLPGSLGRLPWIQFEQGRVLSNVVQVFRQSAVRVGVTPVPGLAEISNPPLDRNKLELGYPSQSFRLESAQPIEVPVSVLPNRPMVRAEQATWLYHNGQSWQAEVACRYWVADGIVDDFRVELPAAMAGLKQINPPTAGRTGKSNAGGASEFSFDDIGIVPLSNAISGGLSQLSLDESGTVPLSSRRLLIVQPPSPVSSFYEFRLAGPLNIEPGVPLILSEITLARISDARQFLVLTGEAQSRPIAWDVQGLKEGILPAGFAAPAEVRAPIVYETVEPPGRVVLQSPDPQRDTAKVRLADIRITWRDDATFRGLAMFDLEGGRLSECSLRLPEGCKLVEFSVDEILTSPLPDGPDAFRVPLARSRLPRRIEVIFTGILPSVRSDGQYHFQAPALVGLPVEQTLWTIAGPTALKAGEPAGAKILQPWQRELIRLKCLSVLIQSATAVGEDDPKKMMNWYRPWAHRYLSARRSVEQTLLASGSISDTQAALLEVRAIDDDQFRLAARFGAAGILSQISSGTQAAGHAEDLWAWSPDPPAPTALLAFSPGVDSLALDYSPTTASDLASRLAFALALAIAVPLGAFGLGRGRARQWLAERPHIVTGCIGMAWWIWLWPSMLGCLIVLVSVLAAVKSHWNHPAKVDA
jgi:hypothetical protein